MVAPDRPGTQDGAVQPRDAIRVYAVDDSPVALRTIAELGQRACLQVRCFDTGSALLTALASDPHVDVVLTDLFMPEMSGMEVLAQVKRSRPEVEVVVTTAHSTLDHAVQAVKLGAYHFLAKPFADLDTPVLVLKQAFEHKRLLGRAQTLESELRQLSPALASTLVGTSDGIERVRRFIAAAAPTPASVLVLGESGTGKELVARAVHEQSDRSKRPFVVVDCSSLAETMLESELFGHVRGAFTGATASHPGLFQAADGGTILLDEVGDAAPAVQVKLLRFLQEGEIRPVGSSKTCQVDVRVVAATNVDLMAAVQRGSFREDLFYRLNVLQVRLPALRDRPDDIVPLVHHLLGRAALRLGRPPRSLSPDALRALEGWRWPGNVRELRNAIERALILGTAPQLELHDFPEPLRLHARTMLHRTPSTETFQPNERYHSAKSAALRAFEATYLEAVMAASGGNVTQAARMAGLDRSNFRRILKRSRPPDTRVLKRSRPPDT